MSDQVPVDQPVLVRLEELYLAQVRALPRTARLLLLLAAADQRGDPRKIWRAADNLGIDRGVAELPAVRRMVTWAPRVQFRHPLIRSAAYEAASAAARRKAHAALAAASDADRDPDRRAWHLAQAVEGADEQVAAELERVAGRARGRGSFASAAAFLELAAGLTADTRHRGRWLLAAAEASLLARDVSAARKLLDGASPHLEDPFAKAQARRLDGLIAVPAGELPRSPVVLLDAARMIAPYDPRLARDTLHEAFEMAQISGRFGVGAAEVLRAVGSLPRATGGQVAIGDLLQDGFAALAEDRAEAGVDLLRRAIAPLTSGQPLPAGVLPRLPEACLAAVVLCDDSALHDLPRRWAAEARGLGALLVLLNVLVHQGYSQIGEGDFAAAEATAQEGRALSAATGDQTRLGGFACLELTALAWRGREAGARRLAGELLRDFADGGSGIGVRLTHHALGVLDLGLGNDQQALRQMLAATADQPVLSFQSEVELLVESAIRCGDRQTAAAALEAFEPRAVASGTHWALGLLACCRALLAADEDAETEYQLAIDHLRQCRLLPQLGRARLLYGEWLRRQDRRRDARGQLRAAHELFGSLGMDAFAERARAELRAAGEHAAKYSAAAPDVLTPLTPQEAQIARLAAEGSPVQEIAARLFLGAGTVDYYLRGVFGKLGVTSGGQLARALGVLERAPGPD